MKDLSIKKLYYSISEVSKITEMEQYVLRYWETGQVTGFILIKISRLFCRSKACSGIKSIPLKELKRF